MDDRRWYLFRDGPNYLLHSLLLLLLLLVLLLLLSVVGAIELMLRRHLLLKNQLLHLRMRLHVLLAQHVRRGPVVSGILICVSLLRIGA